MSGFRQISSIIVLCFMIILIGCGDHDKKQVQTHINNARQFMAEHKVQAAVIEYRNAVNLDPNNGVALFELAEAHMVSGQVGSAVRYYNLTAKATPDSILPYLRLTQVYIQTDQLLEARDKVSKALSISPASIDAHHLLAGIQYKERDIESAIETLNKAVSLDNKNIKTYTSLAQMYLKRRLYDKAEAAYIAAIGHDTGSREAYMGLVRLYASRRKWQKAEKLLQNILKTPGIKVEKYIDMARFYQGRKRFKLAEQYFQNAVKEGKDKAGPLISLAEFYTGSGEMDNAVVAMTEALKIRPGDPLILTGLSQVYLEFNIIEKAAETVDQAMDIAGDNTDVLFQKGRVLMAQNNFQEALDNFDRVIELNKLNAKAYYYRAICIDKRGATDRPEQKIFRAAAGLIDNPEEFEKDQIKGNLLAAISADPTMLDSRIRMMEIYLRENNLKKAKEQMEEIFKLSTPNIKNMTLLSGLRLLEGNLKEAESILLSITTSQPGYLPAYVRLGLLYTDMNKPEKALFYFQKAYEKNPNQIGLVKRMANILMGQKKFEHAFDLVSKLEKIGLPGNEAYFTNLKGEVRLASAKSKDAYRFFLNAAAQAPEYVVPRMHMAKISTQQKKYNKAIEIYKEIEKIDKTYVPALLNAGVIYDMIGNQVNAERYYRKVLDIIPEHPDAANNLAFILSEKEGGTDEALTYAIIAKEKAPKNPNVLDTMGWVYYQKGSYLNALSELKESLKINPVNAMACFHYGMALYRNQQFEEARRYFEKALDIDPHFKDAEIAKKLLN